MNPFHALVVEEIEGRHSIGVKELMIDDLMQGEVTIQVAYSIVNYKDGLACAPNGRIVRSYPMVPGIDLSGTIVTSEDTRFHEGDEVIVTSYGLGVSHYGGFSSYARVPAEWVVPLPQGLTLKEAMALGTAGLAAALSIQRLEDNGLKPDQGPVLVTGATGGVGSLAVSMLANNGYHVVASTGKESEHDYLRSIGAREILTRSEVTPEKFKPVNEQRWAGVVDPVGGASLAYVLSTTQYGGSVAVSGLTGGGDVSTTVFPFILRGVNLLGIDTVNCPMDVRKHLWERMASNLKPPALLDQIAHEITLEELPACLSHILKGTVRGRTIVRM
ncbi:MAG: acryloyl-CoA reductase [Paenibacillaceae bacterium]